jgi:hypothetical protein
MHVAPLSKTLGPVRFVGTHLAELHGDQSGGGRATRPACRDRLWPPRRRSRELWDHYASYIERDGWDGGKV